MRDAVARAFTVGYKGKTIVVSQNQALASISGRLVSLPAPRRAAERTDGTCRSSSSAARCRWSTTRRSSCARPRASSSSDRCACRASSCITMSSAPRPASRSTSCRTSAHQVVQEPARLLIRFDGRPARPHAAADSVAGLRDRHPPGRAPDDARRSSLGRASDPCGPQMRRWTPTARASTLDLFPAPEATPATAHPAHRHLAPHLAHLTHLSHLTHRQRRRS